MSIDKTTAIQYKYKYKAVRYSHIPMAPGQSAVLTADPWSYLHGYLLTRRSKSRGVNKVNLDRAIYYANLAEDFYKSGLATELPVQGTLLYYSMLNLVKCFLAKNGVPLETQVEHHGLVLEPSKKFELTVSAQPKSSISIFAEFGKLLGTPVVGKSSVRLQDAISHIPELHAICHNLGFLKKPKFLNININFLTDSNHKFLFTELSFNKSAESSLPTNKFLTGKRKDYFRDEQRRDNLVVFRSQRRKKVNGDSTIVYKNILKEYSRFSIASLLTRGGFQYYCDLNPGVFHHLCYTFIVMFYIGTAARYRPSEVKEALVGNLRPLVTEAVALCPKQFMYQLVSQIVEQPCVIPYSQI